MTELCSLIGFTFTIPAGLVFDKIKPTGSQVIGGATKHSDYDFIVLCQQDTDVIAKCLQKAGWQFHRFDPDYRHELTGEIPFMTARRGVFNLIIYQEDEGFYYMALATDLAQKLQVSGKYLRLELFRAIMEKRRPTIVQEN